MYDPWKGTAGFLKSAKTSLEKCRWLTGTGTRWLSATKERQHPTERDLLSGADLRLSMKQFTWPRRTCLVSCLVTFVAWSGSALWTSDRRALPAVSDNLYIVRDRTQYSYNAVLTIPRGLISNTTHCTKWIKFAPSLIAQSRTADSVVLIVMPTAHLQEVVIGLYVIWSNRRKSPKQCLE